MTAAAGTGIGSAVARRALDEGADVVVSDHHERRLGETRDQLAELGLGRVESVVCDVTSTAQVDALIASTTARMGRLDVLVNNAGLGGTDTGRRHDRRAVGPGARRHADVGDARYPRRAAATSATPTTAA